MCLQTCRVSDSTTFQESARISTCTSRPRSGVENKPSSQFDRKECLSCTPMYYFLFRLLDYRPEGLLCDAAPCETYWCNGHCLNYEERLIRPLRITTKELTSNPSFLSLGNRIPSCQGQRMRYRRFLHCSIMSTLHETLQFVSFRASRDLSRFFSGVP